MSSVTWTNAWRSVRGRGWPAACVVALLAVAIAGNAVMFAVADSLVLRRHPFPPAAHVHTVPGRVTAPERLDLAASAAVLGAWREQQDLVVAATAYVQKTVFVRAGGALREVRTADVVPGFFDVLGVPPRWGRAFVPADVSDPGAFAVVIGEALARALFGGPTRALGQALDTTAGPHVVVGVADGSFAFPSVRYQMWRALDPAGPLLRNFGGLTPIVRVTPAVPADEVARVLGERAPLVGATAGLSTYAITPRPLFGEPPGERRTLIVLLLGAALSLLFAACANMASVELAMAARRTRVAAVQMALGASRTALAAAAGAEGLVLIGAAALTATPLALVLTSFVGAVLPETLRFSTANAVDLDARAFGAMGLFAALAWMAGVLPVAIAVWRQSVLSLLKAHNRGASASRNTSRIRQTLTVCQVGLAVALVAGAMLFARSYQHLLDVDKGFDSRGLYSITWTMPVSMSTGTLRDRAIEWLRAAPGVEAVSVWGPPPGTGDSPMMTALEIGGQPPASPEIAIGRKWVDVDYFSVVRLPLRQGRLFSASSHEHEVVVPEHFARRFFPAGNAVGQVFRLSAREPWRTIIGVVGDFRIRRTRLPSPEDPELFFYALALPAPQAPAPLPAGIDTGSVTRFLSLTVRTRDDFPEAALFGLARAIEPALPLTVVSVDERYAQMSADTRLAGQVVGAFGGLALLVAAAGIASLMAFLVALRTREIGIRMALGADVRAISRMVLGASLRLTALGVVAGMVLAALGARAAASQFHGVSPLDALTHALAGAVVVASGLIATWWPARRASRVDPAITLRQE